MDHLFPWHSDSKLKSECSHYLAYWRFISLIHHVSIWYILWPPCKNVMMCLNWSKFAWCCMFHVYRFEPNVFVQMTCLRTQWCLLINHVFPEVPFLVPAALYDSRMNWPETWHPTESYMAILELRNDNLNFLMSRHVGYKQHWRYCLVKA